MRHGIRQLAWAVPILAAAGLLGCADSGSDSSRNASRPASPPPGPTAQFDPVPATISEVDAAIGQQKGKVVLVDFWATWCTPCVQSFPQLVRLHNSYSSKGLVVYAVSMDDDDDREDVRAFLRRQDAGFTCFLLKKGDPDTGKVMKERFKFGGGIPHTALFDKSGNRVWAGHPESVRLDQKIEQELAK